MSELLEDPVRSDWLPQGTELGQLRLRDILDYYDSPCLFTCENDKGQLFLVTWESTTNIGYTWLYAPIEPDSIERLSGIDEDSRDILIREFLERPECGYGYRVTEQGEDVFVEKVHIGEL